MADNYIRRRAEAYAKRAQHAWEAYQASGERRYDREYVEFNMIADALRKAADDEDHMQKYFNAEQRLNKAAAQVMEMLQSPTPDYEQCTAILLQTIVAVRFWG